MGSINNMKQKNASTDLILGKKSNFVKQNVFVVPNVALEIGFNLILVLLLNTLRLMQIK